MKKLLTNLLQVGCLSGVTLIFVLTSCSKNSPYQNLFGPDLKGGLYSNRSTVSEPFITILKLRTPALLETARRENGKLVIDQDLLARIQDEQSATIDQLKALSPDIRVLLRYKSVLNGLAIWAPGDLYEKIASLPNVTLTEKAGTFSRVPLAEVKKMIPVGSKTSVKFIGSESAYSQNIRGQGMKVGIIDTGIDYTHKMFLGEGTKEAYESIDPSQATTAFPNKKIVGGIDLVGTLFNSASNDPSARIPRPDLNPIDESGHGTHVAGTVAGLGDGVNTYDGVAPDASLYAIKVFGTQGSTSDEVVIAALEYAVNPSGDLNYEDQLDVVNLSLGSGYGNPHIMYSTAIKNTVKGGTVVVASAGNSGDKSYIVGAPSIAEDAISVASSIDDMDQNILFPSVVFSTDNSTFADEFVEAAMTKPIATVDFLKSSLIDVGYADQELEQAVKSLLKGKIAFIERGKVSFAEKIKRAQDAGAIAVIVMNNNDDPPFVMGADAVNFNIPGVMIGKKEGLQVRAYLKNGSNVIADLKSSKKIEKPWLIDTISDFSSRGPRSEDALIKPEITAPGTNIISASRGQGHEGAALSGTSMAAPHIAGVMAILKQKFNSLDAAQLKSVLLGHAKTIADKNKQTYSVSRQGAGRVQIEASLTAKVVSIPATLSFGITDLEKQKNINLSVKLKNISSQSLTLAPQWKGSPAMKILMPVTSLAPGEEKIVSIKANLNAEAMKNNVEEVDGFLQLIDDQKAPLLQMPALAVVRKISQVKATSLVVSATSESDSAGSDVQLQLTNQGLHAGEAYLFNMLGTDNRKPNNKPDWSPNRNCDIQSAGYRVLEKQSSRLLQVAIKLYEGMTTWNTCEVNVQIDSDNDNITDQEIAGLPMSSLPGLKGDDFISLLLDGRIARDLRKKFEAQVKADPQAKEDYTAAVQDMRSMKKFNNATLAIIEADISKLALSQGGELSLKISTTHQDSGVDEYDDYLDKQATQWKKISVSTQAQAYVGIPEVLNLGSLQSQTIQLTKGYGDQNLIMYAPQNRSVRDVLLEDSQSQVISPIFKVDDKNFKKSPRKNF